MANLSVDFCGTEFKNPIVTASGTFGVGREYAPYFDLGLLGGVTAKTVTLDRRQGNPSPRIASPSCGLVNCIGLQNPGVYTFITQELPYLKSLPTRYIVNISGESLDDYHVIATQLSGLVSFIEVNISCPNVSQGMLFGQSPKLAYEVTRIVRKRAKGAKIIIKLTPNVTDISSIAKAVEAAGADAVSLINTVQATDIDPVARKRAVSNGTGGLSGPSIFPIALRCVDQVAHAVTIPVIGMGGVSSGIDAAKMICAGATLVGVGTANFTDVDNRAPVRIIRELDKFCDQHNIANVTELIRTVS